MPLNALHHVTVKTNDLEATRDFYRDVLGLKVGFRPDLNFPGYWLYCGDIPVVHLVPRENAIGGGPSNDTGPFDHFAFLAEDFAGIKANLERRASNTARTTSPARRSTSCSSPTTTTSWSS
jgi:catechol 2,3-dioxygenase-like lactoylglutathione lyase family enzyme